ncbi:Crp/Fnr family transcriptional regulator [Chryseobacterium sp. SSA4.19]|uniref:Crp/Fnr family transcriptional regulator n=1 Tax=Chryseobacterium sp. SSA4.19 TaxID=2919915 RepID=UPI001F4EFB3A|nr:Crp/Fnr family transcriptional regulator [Chryseobacterium sp. SSA4.19]MCJ8154642.1 Crp/Fnr family transcriptional regulator [Chryseobacterium sp. SSA4.19]
MLISEELLQSYGAETEQLQPSDVIFNEGDTPRQYYQVKDGRIKLNHYDADGKELILAVLHSGLSVCELMLFIDKNYPVNAVVMEPTTIIKLPTRNFTRLLDEHPLISRDINRFLSERLYFKFIMLRNNTSLRPEIRIKGALEYHKSFSYNPEKFSFEVPFTRQQLASITGLRVETVVRTVKKLEREGYLKIINRKIYV